MQRSTDAERAEDWKRRFVIVLVLLVLLIGLPAIYLAQRFLLDTPVDYVNIEDHFKYGSTGGEHEAGFPYWIWRAMPEVCAAHLPGKGLQSLGLIFEKGPNGKDRDLPVGVSKRRYQGVDRVFFNCATCHTSTMRKTKDSARELFLGMPANRLDIMGFEKFVFECAADAHFSKEWVLAEIDRQGGDLDLLDRYLVYPVAIAIMRDRLLALGGRFNWIYSQHDWGVGRVDTFNSNKVHFNYPMDKLAPQEWNAPADYPSIWLQRLRKEPREMQLHWDGNNALEEERNKNAAFGTGTTPPTIDLARIKRIEDWLLDVKPPAYSKYFPVDQNLAAKGAGLYKEYCASCHGASGSDFSGEYVGTVTPWEKVSTDRRRLDSFTYELAVNLATNYAGYPWRFTHYRKTFGYANMPLDGLWLRAPYLHNGSVPTLRDLLEPADKRPKVFYRGNDLYDPVKVGFVSDIGAEGDRKYFKYDTALDGNGNGGHEGKVFGTELSVDEKAALVEFLKTF
jgi:mono/diheme cytochrome c family protein